jgi:MFS transporter, DHA1 family, multidrug resistance protein
VVESQLGWRWVFWIMMIYAAACTVIMFVILPETFTPVLLATKAKKLRKAEPEKKQEAYAEHEKLDWSFKGVIYRSIYRPFYMLYKELILVLITIYLSVIYGVLYARKCPSLCSHDKQFLKHFHAVFEAFPVAFIDRRGFTISQNGLTFIGIGVGSTIGALLNICFSLHYPQLVKKWKGFPPPEERLYGAMVAGPCFVVGIFWFGWTAQYASIPWYVPIIGTILIGTSVCLIFVSLLAYVIETYL